MGLNPYHYPQDIVVEVWLTVKAKDDLNERRLALSETFYKDKLIWQAPQLPTFGHGQWASTEGS